MRYDSNMPEEGVFQLSVIHSAMAVDHRPVGGEGGTILLQNYYRCKR